MSYKLYNNTVLYSLEQISYDFISFNTDRATMYRFIKAMVNLNVLDKEVFRYSTYVKYNYKPSVWFEGFIEGHYHTEKITLKGKETNGTIYFDKYACTILSRLYRYYELGKVQRDNVLNTIYKIIKTANIPASILTIA